MTGRPLLTTQEARAMITIWVARIRRRLNGDPDVNPHVSNRMTDGLQNQRMPSEARSAVLDALSDLITGVDSDLWGGMNGQDVALGHVMPLLALLVDARGDWSTGNPNGERALALCAKLLQAVADDASLRSSSVLAATVLLEGGEIEDKTRERLAESVAGGLLLSGEPLGLRCAMALMLAGWPETLTGPVRPCPDRWRAILATRCGAGVIGEMLGTETGTLAEALTIRLASSGELCRPAQRSEVMMRDLRGVLGDERAGWLADRWPALRSVDGFEQAWQRRSLAEVADRPGREVGRRTL